MPTRLNANYSRPTDPDEFESMIRDICALEWGDPHIKRFGRKGQKQYGIDIFGLPVDQQKIYRGAQCKLRTKDNQLSETEIEAEIEGARQFPLPLDTLIIVTDTSRDTNTQILIEKISQREKASNGFQVGIWFWEDITERLAAHPHLLIKYFKNHYASLSTLPIIESLADKPISIFLEAHASPDLANSLAQALLFRGIKVIDSTKQPAFTGMNIGDAVSPDGVVCILDELSTDGIEITSVRYVTILQIYIRQIEEDCPLFAIVPTSAMQTFRKTVKSQGFDLNRVTLLELEQPINELADQILGYTFSYGYARRGGLSTIDICARTHNKRPRSALLDIDWSKKLSTSQFPSPEEWDAVFVPAIIAVKEQVLACGDGLRIQINSQLPIPAAMAFGYLLNLRVAKVGIWARKSGASDFRHQFWFSDGVPNRYHHQPHVYKNPDIGAKSAIVELTAYVSIHESVSEFASASAIACDAWLGLNLVIDGKTSENITEGEAINFANQVGQVVRQLNSQGILDIHLFARIPSALGILIGQRLIACGRIHLYWFTNSDDSYRYAFTLA